MTEDNVAVVRQLYSTFQQADIAALAGLLSDDVDWLFYGPVDIPFAGQYYGPEEVKRFFAAAMNSMEFLEFEPRDFIAASGNRVLVQGHERGRAKATGRTWETEWAHVFTLSNSKIVKLREYYDTAAIVAAFRPE